MQSLACLFNADNVWANIQLIDDPVRCSLELGNAKCFRPFFSLQQPQQEAPSKLAGLLKGKNSAAAAAAAVFNKESAARQYALSFAPLQKAIHYTEESLEWYTSRALRLERLVERRFESWRRGRQSGTRWDYGVATVLRDLLAECERHAQGEDSSAAAALRAAGSAAAASSSSTLVAGGGGMAPGSALALAAERPLSQLAGAYGGSVVGFPLHFSDAGDQRLLEGADEANPLLQAVRHTRVHESDEPRAVFALAVYIHPYPNRMGSVWLYIACLVDK